MDERCHQGKNNKPGSWTVRLGTDCARLRCGKPGSGMRLTKVTDGETVAAAASTAASTAAFTAAAAVVCAVNYRRMSKYSTLTLAGR